MPRVLMPTLLSDLEGAKRKTVPAQVLDDASACWYTLLVTLDAYLENRNQDTVLGSAYADLQAPKFFVDYKPEFIEGAVEWFSSYAASIANGSVDAFIQNCGSYLVETKVEGVVQRDMKIGIELSDNGELVAANIKSSLSDVFKMLKFRMNPKVIAGLESRYALTQKIGLAFKNVKNIWDEIEQQADLRESIEPRELKELVSPYNKARLAFAIVDAVELYKQAMVREEVGEDYCHTVEHELNKLDSQVKASMVSFCWNDNDVIAASVTAFIKLENRIRELQNELETTWIYHPHCSRKQNKIKLLQQIVKQYNKNLSEQGAPKTMNAAVDMVKGKEKNKSIISDLTAGVFSSRTKKLLEELTAEENQENQENTMQPGLTC